MDGLALVPDAATMRDRPTLLLPLITSPTLVCVGALDPVTPVPASEEILAGLGPEVGRLEVLEGAGHFPWLDVPDRYWTVIRAFITGDPA